MRPALRRDLISKRDRNRIIEFFRTYMLEQYLPKNTSHLRNRHWFKVPAGDFLEAIVSQDVMLKCRAQRMFVRQQISPTHQITMSRQFHESVNSASF